MEARFSGQMHNPILMNSLRLNFMQILKEEDVKCLRKERGNKRIEQSLDLSFELFVCNGQMWPKRLIIGVH